MSVPERHIEILPFPSLPFRDPKNKADLEDGWMSVLYFHTLMQMLQYIFHAHSGEAKQMFK